MPKIKRKPPIVLPLPILEQPIRDGYLKLSCYDGKDVGLLYLPFLTALHRSRRVAVIGYLWDYCRADLLNDPANPVESADDLLDCGSSEVRCIAPPGMVFPDQSCDHFESILAGRVPGIIQVFDMVPDCLYLTVDRTQLTEACKAMVEIAPKLIAEA